VTPLKAIGYLALIERFSLETLAPEIRSYLLDAGHRRSVIESGRQQEWYPPRADPGETWTDHLAFALKREGINLEVLAALFAVAPRDELVAFVRRSPTGRYARLAWFLFEWLTGETLPLPDLDQGNYLPVVDPDQYLSVAAPAETRRVRRQRVLDNLPGTPAYCPLVRRTATLDSCIAERLDQRVRQVLDRYPAEIVARAAQYLFIKETKSSYQIERLEPDQRRTARFVELLRQAGSVACAIEEELTALQRLIVDPRYAAAGFRDCQNYVGQSLGPGRELIHYVTPKPEDVASLMSGWETCSALLATGDTHPVVVAAVLGFGFVFIHPFEDGNGRLHRFLIHHALAVGGFTPEGVIFPISAVMLRDRARYDAALEWYSREVMQHVEYRMSDAGELTVLNETALHYRYPDLTHATEELFAFVRDTVEREFTAELEYLTVFDLARRQLADVVDMPDGRLDLFIRLVLQGKGRLSRRKRSSFSELADDEVARMESVIRDALAQLSLDATTGVLDGADDS
jgi:hypothetical protein